MYSLFSCAERLVMVSHDTGAANALSVFAGALRRALLNPRVICSGYAGDVFRKAGIIPDKEYTYMPDRNEVASLFKEMNPMVVLLGTSFDSWIERWFCEYARERGIYSLAFTDWWSNFGRRFSSPGSRDLRYLPDAIAVIDEDAKEGCLEDGIPKELLHTTGNPYFDFLADWPSAKEQEIRNTLRQRLGIPGDSLLGLIISSNIRNMDLNLGYDERDFLEAIKPLPRKTRDGVPVVWVMKPHPTESLYDLRSMLSELWMDIPVLEGISGIEAVAVSDIVIGMCSSLLFEAALRSRRVVSLQPGLDRKKLKYLRVFDHIGVPKIITKDEARDMVIRLVDSRIPLPNLKNLPFSVGGNVSTDALLKIIGAGLGPCCVSLRTTPE